MRVATSLAVAAGFLNLAGQDLSGNWLVLAWLLAIGVGLSTLDRCRLTGR